MSRPGRQPKQEKNENYEKTCVFTEKIRKKSKPPQEKNKNLEKIITGEALGDLVSVGGGWRRGVTPGQARCSTFVRVGEAWRSLGEGW